MSTEQMRAAAEQIYGCSWEELHWTSPEYFEAGHGKSSGERLDEAIDAAIRRGGQ